VSHVPGAYTGDGQAMYGVGDVLRQTRSRRGLSLEEVERATRIPRKYLLALEEGDVSRLPSPAYARGFLRAYANYLGLDEGEVLSLLPRTEEELRLRPLVRVERVSGLSGRVLGLGAVLASLALALALVLGVAWDRGGAARLGARPGGLVPDFTGRSVTSALSSLQEAGLSFVLVELAPASEGEAKVVEQAPPPWAPVEGGGPVLLVVGR